MLILLFIPVAIVVFLSLFMIAHGVSPLNKDAVTQNHRSSVFVYSFIALTVLYFSLAFTDILNTTSDNIEMAYMITAIPVCVIGTECAYYLSKKNKWNRVLVGVCGTIGVFFTGVALVVAMGYAS